MFTVYWFQDIDGARTYKRGDYSSRLYGQARTAAEWIDIEGDAVFFCSTYYTDNAPTCRDCGISTCFVYEVWGPVGKSSPCECVVVECNSCKAKSSFNVDGLNVDTTAVEMRKAHEAKLVTTDAVNAALRAWGHRHSASL